MRDNCSTFWCIWFNSCLFFFLLNSYCNNSYHGFELIIRKLAVISRRIDSIIYIYKENMENYAKYLVKETLLKYKLTFPLFL